MLSKGLLILSISYTIIICSLSIYSRPFTYYIPLFFEELIYHNLIQENLFMSYVVHIVTQGDGVGGKLGHIFLVLKVYIYVIIFIKLLLLATHLTFFTSLKKPQ